MLGQRQAERVRVPVLVLPEPHRENSNLPTETFPDGVTVGQTINTPQTTEQHKYQFRDDFTWTKGRHELKVGASFIYEPTLDITFSTGQQPHTRTSRTAAPRRSRASPTTAPSAAARAAARRRSRTTSTRFYVQDAWRVNDKLTLDLGVRYDLVTGFAFDQDGNILFAELQAAARAGVFQRSGLPCPCPGFEDFGQEPEEDTNNFAPRARLHLRRRRRTATSSSAAAWAATTTSPTRTRTSCSRSSARSRPSAQVYSNTNSAGIRNADGSLFQVGQPLPPEPAHAT